ncbi:MAG: GHMP kinase [Bacilli bacterium]|jgi:D-glycero-alpha-D-manno-heptose-7-phosphate kinase|nr:GHMP kinase [Bacilli bacterium]
MIISRAPLSISLCGDGSDVRSFYEKFGGCVISTSIRKYAYVYLNPSFDKNSITLRYSETESVSEYKDIKHKYFRQVLRDFNVKGVEITSMSDIPSSAGFGSSSSFLVALLKLIHTYREEPINVYSLAQEASKIEIDELNSRIGKTDHFSSAFGGLRFYEYAKDGSVTVNPIVMSSESYRRLQNNLVMFYFKEDKTLETRFIDCGNKNMANDVIKQIGEKTRLLKTELESNNIDALGPILNDSWNMRAPVFDTGLNTNATSNYLLGISSGATGGKLFSVNGGYFLLFYVPSDDSREKVRKVFHDANEITFELDQAGCSIIFME